MTIQHYDLSNMSQEEKDELLIREASRKVTYLTADGQRLQHIPDPPRERLKIVCPHPVTGVRRMVWDSEECRNTVFGELGAREPANEDEYVSCLTHVAREKGWVIEWPKPTAVVPVAPKKKRGRPKGSKNKKKAKVKRAKG